MLSSDLTNDFEGVRRQIQFHCSQEKNIKIVPSLQESTITILSEET